MWETMGTAFMNFFRHWTSVHKHVHQCTWHQGLDTWVLSKDRGWAFIQLTPKDLLGRTLDRPGRHKSIVMVFWGWLQFPPQGESLPDSEGRFGHWVGVDCVLCLHSQRGSLELDKFSAVSVGGNPWSWWWTPESNWCCKVEWFRRSQPKGLEHLFRMSSLSRHVALQESSRKTQKCWRDYVQLEEVSGVKESQASLLSLLPLWPCPR